MVGYLFGNRPKNEIKVGVSKFSLADLKLVSEHGSIGSVGDHREITLSGLKNGRVLAINLVSLVNKREVLSTLLWSVDSDTLLSQFEGNHNHIYLD